MGEPSSVKDFYAFMAPATVPTPAPRGEVLLCPINDKVAVMATVVESRVGGDCPVLVLYTNDPANDLYVAQLKVSPGWQVATPATTTIGEVMGVFLDVNDNDIIGVPEWPEWNTSEVSSMIACGLIGDITTIEVHGVDFKDVASVPCLYEESEYYEEDDTYFVENTEEEVNVVNLRDWRNYRERM